MHYTLYNKRDKKQLVHPTVGVWFTSNYQEAEDMLTACYEWLEDRGISEAKDHFVIIDVETGKEIEDAPTYDIERSRIRGEGEHTGEDDSSHGDLSV